MFARRSSSSTRTGALLRHLALLAALLIAPRLSAVDAPLLPPPLAPGDPLVKVNSLLRAALAQPHTGPINHHLAHVTSPARQADHVVLRLDAADGPADLAAIAATGVLIRSHSTRYHEVVVEATLDQIPALAALGSVRWVKPALRPWHRSGLPPDQADTLISTNLLRTAYATTGTSSVTVGVISDSIHDTLGGTLSSGILTGDAAQNTGANPAKIAVVSDDEVGGGTDEGYAMMEEIYSLVPNCSYAFGAANFADTDMATSIDLLSSSAHCKVICDDVGFPDEPVFQDGPIARAAEAFVQAGGVYSSAAGNDAAQSVRQTFSSMVPGANDVQTNGVPNANDLHNWGLASNPAFLPITIGPGVGLNVVLEWNQPYQSWNLGHGSQADFGVYICSSPSLNSVLTFNDDQQGTTGAPSGDPWEFAYWVNPSSTNNETVYIAIDHVRGVTACVLQCMFLTDGAPLTGPSIMNGPTTYGHPCAQDVLGAAAVDQNSAQSTSFPGTPESFTSKGGWGSSGLPFYFDTSGNALPNAPVLRNKPDVAAPDNIIYTSSNYNYQQFFYYGFANFGFQGTSAATPHVAAAAALAFSARPSLTNWQVINGLRGTATDITTGTSSTGADAWTGFGMINALRTAGIPVTSIGTTATSGIYATGSLTLSVTFSAAVTVTGSPRIQLNTSPVEYATYVGGSGSSTLTFTYAIQPGDTSANLAPSDVAALQLNGGTILDGSSNPADTALPGASGAPGGMASPFASSGTVDVAAVPPTATLTPTPSISNAPGFSFAIQFSQPVSTLSAGSLSESNCTLNSLTQNSSSLYTATVTATNPGTVTLTVPASAVTNGAYGNVVASGSATYDITPPTLTISLPATVDTTTTTTATFTFSKVVTGFAASQVSVTGGTPGTTVSGSGTTYTLPITAGAVGTMTVSVAATTAVHDLAGNTLTTGATASDTVVNPPPPSKHCGLGSIALVVGSLTLWCWRRRQPARIRA